MISIDRTLCIGCARCVAACPMGIFRQGEDGGVEVGREKRCIRCGHCSAACPCRAVRFEDLTTRQTYPAPREDDLARLVEGRRSIRRFRPEPPAKELLEDAMSAASFAPSAKNRRVARWTVLYGKERADRAARLALDWAVETHVDPALTAMARGGVNLVTCGAPCVLVCHALRAAEAVTDGAIAMTTLELLLVKAGLGTCWAGYFARISDVAPALRAWMGLPEEDEVLCALMAGYPDGDTYPNLPPRTDMKINWID